MSDVKRFRDRATDCRALALGARNPEDAEMLGELADELDAEADKIEAEIAASTAGPIDVHPPTIKD